jgi:nucleoside-diphosphate-sugar epimerase
LSVCRLFNLSGPFIHKEFALNSIIISILNKRDIELRTDHDVFRDFIHVKDLVTLGFMMMLDSHLSFNRPYDSGIGVPVEIEDLAMRSLALLGEKNLKILRGKKNKKEEIYVGDVRDILSLFANYELKLACLDEQILDTAQYLKMFMGLA